MASKTHIILTRVAGLVLALMLAALVAVQMPGVQTSLTKKAVELIQQKIDGTVEVGSARILPTGALIVKDLVILDNNPYVDPSGTFAPADTFFKAGTISATFRLKTFLKRGDCLYFGRVGLKNGYIHLADEPGRERKINLQRMFNTKPPKEEPVETGDIFEIRKLYGTDVGCKLTFLRHGPKPGGYRHFTVNDMDLNAPVIRGHGIKFTKGRMHGTLDHMEFDEKSGFHATHMSGHCIVGMGQTLVDNFTISDGESEIHLPRYTMNYRNGLAFRDFLHLVTIDADFGPSRASAKTLTALTGALDGSNMLLDIASGHVHGPVSDLHVSNFAFKDIPSGVHGNLDLDAAGLPDIKGLTADAEISSFQFTTATLTTFLSEILGRRSPDLRRYAPGYVFNLSGKARGPLDRLDTDLSLASGAGSAHVVADVRNLLSSAPLSLSGLVTAHDLDISEFISSDAIGHVSATAALDAKLVKGNPSVRIDSLKISSMEALGYEYRDIMVNGQLADGSASAGIVSDDPSIKLRLDGKADLKPKGESTSYRLEGSIDNADLLALNLDRRGRSSVSGGIFVDFTTFTDGSVLGDAFLDNVRLTNDDGDHEIGDITVGAHTNEGRQTLNFSSTFADISFTGDRPIPTFVEDLQRLTTRRELPSLYAKEYEEPSYGSYDLNLDFHDSRELMSFIKPGIYVADSTGLALSVNPEGELEGRLKSSRIALGAKYIRNAILDIDNHSSRLAMKISGSEINAGFTSFDSPVITADADDDRLALGISYKGHRGNSADGAIRLDGQVMRFGADTVLYRAKPRDSHFHIGSSRWQIDGSDITLCKGDVNVDSFSITSGRQGIFLKGGSSLSHADTLGMEIRNVDLAILNEFTKEFYSIWGTVSGSATLTSPIKENMQLVMSLGGDSFGIGEHRIGSMNIDGNWDSAKDDIELQICNSLDGRDAIFGHGHMNPGTKEIDVDLSLDGFGLHAISPMVAKIFSGVDGSISGHLLAGGTIDAPEITGYGLRFNDAMLTVAYTGVPYTIDGPFRLSPSSLDLSGVSVRDSEGGTARIDGGLSFINFKDFTLDTKLDFNELLVFDTQATGASRPYGHLAATGNAALTGPLNSIQVNASLANAGRGEIHVPMSGSLSSSTSNLLTFAERVKPVDPYDQMMEKYRQKKKATGELNARAHVAVSPDLRAFVEIDKANGNMATFNGSGNVNLDIRTAKSQVDINGDYSINEGNYHFVLPGILEKDFIINQGSSVKFSGDLMDSDLDISAVYNLKTSLSTLIADTTGVATRRLVECGINVNNKLRNPDVGFSINVPDLDPTTKSQVESALNTEDKIQKQFVSLLLMGSFLPSETSGVFNGTNVLYSNVGNVMSNQLNSILQKLEIPVDFGFGYQGLQSGASIFDVAISTQLFNNRVVVNGSLGNRRYAASANGDGDMVGDLDIEVKLDKPGKFRLNLFSHSADEYTNYLDLSQRNGVGLSYQKEYNRLSEFLKDLFSSRAKREQRAQEEASRKSGEVVIKIENE